MITYAHSGRPANAKQARATAWHSDFASPYDTTVTIESMLEGSGRKNQSLMVIQSSSAEELNTRDPTTPQIVCGADYTLTMKVTLNSPYGVVMHLESYGGNPHTHLTIANVDLVTGNATYDSDLQHWILKRANDKIIREIGLQVLESTPLAQNVNHVRSHVSAPSLTVDELNKSTWLEFLTEDADEAIFEPHSADFNRLHTVAREHDVSIEKKTRTLRARRREF